MSMDGTNYDPGARTGLPDNSHDNANPNVMSIEQLRRLVQLLDKSDVSELHFKRPVEGTHLVLRKANAPENIGHTLDQHSVSIPVTLPEKVESDKTEYQVLAPLV